MSPGTRGGSGIGSLQESALACQRLRPECAARLTGVSGSALFRLLPPLPGQYTQPCGAGNRRQGGPVVSATPLPDGRQRGSRLSGRAGRLGMIMRDTAAPTGVRCLRPGAGAGFDGVGTAGLFSGISTVYIRSVSGREMERRIGL